MRMLLRRVMNHLRKQEWTAIGINFLIVVIGVFVATQVSNWNAEGAEHRRGLPQASPAYRVHGR